MHSEEPARSRLTALRNALLNVHKTLLDSERGVYERDIARISTNTQFLGLLLHDPWFAWLHELSEMVVLIDEMLDAKEPPATPADADRMLAEARMLLSPAENGEGFRKRYFDALQRDPDVVLKHGATMKILAGLE
jgi:hypothetical protein